MRRSQPILIVAIAATAALLAAGCVSVPGQGQGSQAAMMAEHQRCMMTMNGKQDGQPGMPTTGKPMDCNCQCPMMQQQKAAADAPPASAAQHDHAPDAPPPASH